MLIWEKILSITVPLVLWTFIALTLVAIFSGCTMGDLSKTNGVVGKVINKGELYPHCKHTKRIVDNYYMRGPLCNERYSYILYIAQVDTDKVFECSVDLLTYNSTPRGSWVACIAQKENK